MHTVELLLDRVLEDGVRHCWNRLREAGLPSLATHPHPTNRPHLTVLTAASVAGPPPGSLPLTASLGPACLLGRALVLAVTPTPELRALQAAAFAAATDPWPDPADWTPHVSLALNVRPADRDAALRAMESLPPLDGFFTAARTYDTDTRTVTAL